MEIHQSLADPLLFKQQAYTSQGWIESEEQIEVFNPSNNQLLGKVPSLNFSEVRIAIHGAEQAMIDWKKYSPIERSTYLKKWILLIRENQNDIAKIITAESGKPFFESINEVKYSLSFFEWFSNESCHLKGDIFPSPDQNFHSFVFREPIGLVLGITPNNFPFSMVIRKVVPALVTGCAIIIKPNEQTPFSALLLAELAQRANIPLGIFSVLTGCPVRLGEFLTQEEKIRLISFTGSVNVGKKIASQATKTVKRVILELGGNAPFIIFEDADIQKAVKDLMMVKFRNNGQTCISVNRLLVDEKIKNTVMTLLMKEISNLRVGDGMDKDVNQGPLINKLAVEKIESLLDDAIKNGAKICLGGQRHKLGGNFFQPTLLLDCSEKMRIWYEEIFGPILPIFSFQGEEEAIRMANNTEFGLSSYLYSINIERCLRVSRNLEYGMIGINTSNITSPSSPFSGVKNSGYGVHGSIYSLENYLTLKSVVINYSY